VAIKPGKPFAFGKIGKSWLFGLPGNPAAVAVTFRQLVYPALKHLMGSGMHRPLRIRAVAECRLPKKAGRMEFRSGLFHERPDGSFGVKDFTNFGSHRMGILSQANCFIVLPLQNNGVEQGEIVEIEPFQTTIQSA
jgi:molybdopterin molybdotransferase